MPPPSCLVCRQRSAGQPAPVPGLKGGAPVLVAVTCSEACAARARRFAARRAVQAAPAGAGLMVAALGVATGIILVATGRDLGRALIVIGLLGAGTTRLAYPDTVPLVLVRWLGLEPALELGRWAGVAIGLLAVAVAAAFLLG